MDPTRLAASLALHNDDEFEPAATLPGKVFVPRARGPKKHRCPDCMECGWCGEDRCRLCRRLPGRCRVREEGASREGG